MKKYKVTAYFEELIYAEDEDDAIEQMDEILEGEGLKTPPDDIRIEELNTVI